MSAQSLSIRSAEIAKTIDDLPARASAIILSSDDADDISMPVRNSKNKRPRVEDYDSVSEGESSENPAPIKKRRILVDEGEDDQVKVKIPNVKSIMKQKIMDAYNCAVPTEEHIKKFTKLSLDEMMDAYEETDSFKKRGFTDSTFQKIFTERVRQMAKNINDKRSFEVSVQVPNLDSRDQYIHAIASLYIEKYCRNEATGNYEISIVPFQSLTEVLKHEVYSILKHRGVLGCDELAKCLHIGEFTRNVRANAAALLREGVSSVNLTYDLTKI